MNNILNAIRQRWSPRAFSDKEIDNEKLRRIIEAARLAPSAMNEQPWLFFLAKRKDDNWHKIFPALAEFNQLWAIHAPLLILVSARKLLTSKGDMPNPTCAYDTGQAVAYLSLQAMEEGIYTHQMSGFDKSIIMQNFRLNEHTEPITVIALGYIGNPEILPPKIRALEKGPKTRMPIQSFTFGDGFEFIHNEKTD